jgi:hypothetical protein
MSIRDALEEMLAEFESSRLEVVLVPQRIFTNSGGMIRVAAGKNCQWYRQFCASFPSSRVRKKAAFDTVIRRQEIARILHRMAVHGPCSTRSKYAQPLLSIATYRVRYAGREAASMEARRSMSERLWRVA